MLFVADRDVTPTSKGQRAQRPLPCFLPPQPLALSLAFRLSIQVRANREVTLQTGDVRRIAGPGQLERVLLRLLSTVTLCVGVLAG